jgi:epoxyqueuosine reductase
MPPSAAVTLAADLKAEASRSGCDLVGIAPAVTPTGFTRLQDWLAKGFAGEMTYLPRRASAYEHPRSVLPPVRSIVMIAVNYKAGDEPPAQPHAGRVARYARGGVDYHHLLRERLQHLADWLHQQVPGCRTRAVVDTAPLLERDFAQLAGLGWFGKNTMLIHKRAGSFLLLGGLLTDVDLPSDEPHHTAHCGTCTRCLDICPTDAFPEPYVLDARRCIAYATIELKGPIPSDLREGIGDWLFGCDLCQDVCPWNRKSPRTNDPAFQPRNDLHPADAVALLQLTEDEFQQRYRDTPLGRPGRSGLRRNAALVLGNRRESTAIPALIAACSDDDPVVRDAAAWALEQFDDPAAQ